MKTHDRRWLVAREPGGGATRWTSPTGHRWTRPPDPMWDLPIRSDPADVHDRDRRRRCAIVGVRNALPMSHVDLTLSALRQNLVA